MVTDNELQQIMPNLSAAKRKSYLPHLQAAMKEFEITSFAREAAFLAQLAHESAELRYMEEIASGAAYEGRKNLGNTEPGDGKRFKGRGPIQLTGRANYKKYGALLGLDLIANPTQAATPEVGFRIAALFWKLNGLNQLADQGAFITITKRINGGTNGLADRQKYYARAKLVLSRDDPPTGDVTVKVDNEKVSGLKTLSRGGFLMVALKPVAAAANWKILQAVNGHATVQDALGENHEMVLLIQDGTGFVRWDDLPGTSFNSLTREAILKTESRL